LKAYAQRIGVTAVLRGILWTGSHFVRKALFYRFFINVNKK
jgi:hypothetical protein